MALNPCLLYRPTMWSLVSVLIMDPLCSPQPLPFSCLLLLSSIHSALRLSHYLFHEGFSDFLWCWAFLKHSNHIMATWEFFEGCCDGCFSLSPATAQHMQTPHGHSVQWFDVRTLRTGKDLPVLRFNLCSWLLDENTSTSLPLLIPRNQS